MDRTKCPHCEVKVGNRGKQNERKMRCANKKKRHSPIKRKPMDEKTHLRWTLWFSARLSATNNRDRRHSRIFLHIIAEFSCQIYTIFAFASNILRTNYHEACFIL